MTATRRGWRGALAAPLAAAMVGAGIGAGAHALEPVAGARPAAVAAGRATLAPDAPTAGQVMPSAVLLRTTEGLRPVAVFNEGRHRAQRALGADATSVQVQLPGGPQPRSGRPAGVIQTGGHAAAPPSQPMTAGAAHAQRRAAGHLPAHVPAGQTPAGPSSTTAVTALPMPWWRALLEARWQARLRQVTELSLAYHDAAEHARDERDSGDHAAMPQLRRLMRLAVSARRALADTEEALSRLSARRYGYCENCAAAIPHRLLALTPEARYCPRCAPEPPAARLASDFPASGPHPHARAGGFIDDGRYQHVEGTRPCPVSLGSSRA